MFVAHRLRTIYDSDKIIVLQDGNVAESGSHSELLNKKGVYVGLWKGRSLLAEASSLLTISKLRKRLPTGLRKGKSMLKTMLDPVEVGSHSKVT